MATILGDESPVLFLGLADHLDVGVQPFPVGGIDAYQLSQHKMHIIYPGMIQSCVWLFLAEASFFTDPARDGFAIRITHENGFELGSFIVAGSIHNSTEKPDQVTLPPLAPNASVNPMEFAVVPGNLFILIPLRLDSMVYFPGHYVLTCTYKGAAREIGTMDFHYRPTPSLTPDQVQAIKADPMAAKSIRIEMGCKYCATKQHIYTGLSRTKDEAKEGLIWYADAKDEFVCKCGKSRFPLTYLRESMHGLLLKDFSLGNSGLSYVRQYGHAQVAQTAKRFNELLDAETLEAPIQSFLEDNPTLLARFHASRLFKKPDILGKFQADFAIVDSNKELWFIEIERPTLQLFKKDGHPTAKLMHAYEQVKDWLHQYSQYQGAILAALKLSANDVISVRGAVIAGRSADVSHDVLQRHHMEPPYPKIEFLTYDDLATSLVQLSRKLA